MLAALITVALMPVVAGVSAVGATIFLTIGLRGRRVGTELRCRKCGYNLTGTPEGNCPECGTDIAPENAVRGVRQRRWLALTVGIVFSLVTIGSLGVHFSNVDWIRYAPFGVVLRMAGTGDAGALAEIERRHTSGSITASHLDDLAEACLKKQADLSLQLSQILTWLEVLEDLDNNGDLSEAQQARYYKQTVASFNAEVNDRVRAGEPLLVEASFEGRHDDNLSLYLSKGYIQLSGRVYMGTQVGGWSAPRSLRVLAVPFPEEPGEYDVSFVTTLSLNRTWSRAPLLTLTERGTITVEVVAPGIGEEPTPRAAPTLDGWLADAGFHFEIVRCCRPIWLDVPEACEELEYYVCIDMDFQTPIALAFQVAVLDGDHEIPAGYFYCRQGTAELTANLHPVSLDPESKNVSIVLRSDIDVARRPVDLGEFWAGEVVIEDVIVKDDCSWSGEVFWRIPDHYCPKCGTRLGGLKWPACPLCGADTSSAIPEESDE